MRPRVWAKRLLSRIMCVDSFCKVCGCAVRDYRAPDKAWAQVVATVGYRGDLILCYNCFCDVCASIGLPSVWDLEEGRRCIGSF